MNGNRKKHTDLKHTDLKHTDMADLIAFYKIGNTADIIQAREGNDWGAVWTFAPCDVCGAERAAWMVRRIHRHTNVVVRHARRALIQDRCRGADAEVVVVTKFPERTQAVARIEDGVVLRIEAYLADEALTTLEYALANRPRS
jgi:hypothetical protein